MYQYEISSGALQADGSWRNWLKTELVSMHTFAFGPLNRTALIASKAMVVNKPKGAADGAMHSQSDPEKQSNIVKLVFRQLIRHWFDIDVEEMNLGALTWSEKEFDIKFLRENCRGVQEVFDLYSAWKNGKTVSAEDESWLHKAEQYKDQRDLPPIVIIQDEHGTYKAMDGLSRILAAALRGDQKINSYFGVAQTDIQAPAHKESTDAAMTGEKDGAMKSGIKKDNEMEGRDIRYPLFTGGKLNADGIVLVHALDYFPQDGVLYPNNYYGEGPLLLRTPRTIVEFSFNGVIDLWKNSKVIILVPLSSAKNMKFVNFWYTATSYLGPFDIPQGSTIMVQGQPGRVDQRIVKRLEGRGIHIRFFNITENAVDAVSQVLPAMGYEPMKLYAKGSMLGYGTTWTTPGLKDYSWDFDRLGRQFKIIADELGIPNVAGTEDYDVGFVTYLMEQFQKYFISGQALDEPMSSKGININDFMRRVEAAYASLKDKRESLEARKLLAFAEFYTELYKLRDKMGSYDLSLADCIRNMKPGNYYSKKWEEYRPVLIRAVNDLYGFKLASDKLKTSKEYWDVIGRIAQRVMDHYDLPQSVGLPVVSSQADRAMAVQKGGIDMNPAQMSMQLKKQGDDFKFDFNGTEIDAAQVTGATFTIRAMTPVVDLPLILGLSAKN